MRVTEIPLEDRLLLLGAPGIGKTEIIKQKAEEEAKAMGRKFVDLNSATPEELDAIERSPSDYYAFLPLHAPHLMPEDISIPDVSLFKESTKRGVDFLAPRRLAVLGLPGIAGVLFIDEITNVQRRDALTLLFAIIQEKRVGWSLRLADGVKVVAAGNPPETSSVALLLPAPLVNRLTVIEVEPPTVDEWCAYMEKKYGYDEVLGKICAFLHANPDMLLKQPNEVETLSNYPTPRAWEAVYVLVRKYGAHEELVKGRIGPEAAMLFVTFMRATLSEHEISEIAKAPEKYEELRIEKKILLMHWLANNYKRPEFKSIFKYIIEKHEDDAVAVIKMSPNRRELVKMHLDVLKKLVSKLSNLDE